MSSLLSNQQANQKLLYREPAPTGAPKSTLALMTRCNKPPVKIIKAKVPYRHCLRSTLIAIQATYDSRLSMAKTISWLT